MSDIGTPSTMAFSASKFTDPQVESMKANLAEAYVRCLVAMMNEYNHNLDNTRQVALSLVHFGQSITFNVIKIGYWNPSLIIFYGVDASGAPMQLIQHISQISCLLTSVPRENTMEPKRHIGFVTHSEVAATHE
jgi:hypothetical protein